MAVYKDPQQPLDLRMEAAKAAIAYEKPRLAAIEHGAPWGSSPTKIACVRSRQ